MFCGKCYRKIPMLGKHTKKITSGGWSKEGLLALGGEDRVLTVSNAEGDSLRQISIQGEISDIQFSKMKADEKSSIGENTVIFKGSVIQKMKYKYKKYVI